MLTTVTQCTHILTLQVLAYLLKVFVLHLQIGSRKCVYDTIVVPEELNLKLFSLFKVSIDDTYMFKTGTVI